MNILFRADSSSTIGTGHIMRDLVLAKEFEEENLIFASRELDGNINYRIKEDNYPLEVLESNDINELIDLIEKLKIDMLIIDHYGIDAVYEKELKERTGVKIFVFDDTYERHYGDILLNHNIYGNEKKYKDLVPQTCELRCGSKYTLLRDEFRDAKKNKESKLNVKFTFFIAMGGSDILNLNPKILEVLSVFDNIEVNIVTTNANKNLAQLEKYCDNKDWVNLHINSNNMAVLMANSDFAIVTPSVTCNEVYFMELPFIAIKVAQNQSDMYEFLEKNNFPVLENFKDEELTNLIKDFIWKK